MSISGTGILIEGVSVAALDAVPGRPPEGVPDGGLGLVGRPLELEYRGAEPLVLPLKPGVVGRRRPLLQGW